MQSTAIKEALGILKQLRQIMETPESVPEKLRRILETISAKMQADAATCYVAVDDNYLELFAACGFKKRRRTGCACAITKGWPAKWRKVGARW